MASGQRLAGIWFLEGRRALVLRLPGGWVQAHVQGGERALAELAPSRGTKAVSVGAGAGTQPAAKRSLAARPPLPAAGDQPRQST